MTLQSPSHSTRQHHVETTGTAFLCKVSATKVLNVARYYHIPCFRWTLDHSCVVCGCVCECCRSDAVDNSNLVVLSPHYCTYLSCCIHSSIKIHDLQDLKEVYTIISVEEEKGASILAMNTLPLLLVVLGPKCAEIVSQFEVAHY